MPTAQRCLNPASLPDEILYRADVCNTLIPIEKCFDNFTLHMCK